MVVRRIEPLSLGKVLALFYGILGVIKGVQWATLDRIIGISGAYMDLGPSAVFLVVMAGVRWTGGLRFQGEGE